MKWEKLGLIFSADKNFDWMQSHAALPFPQHIKENIFRIFFSTRDQFNKSHGAYLEIDIKEPNNILKLSPEPIISPGQIGLFDDCGTTPCSIVNYKNQNLLYYTGWSLSRPIPYHTYCGLAILNESKNIYEKTSRVPVMDRTPEEPFSVGFLQVIQHKGILKMWYESNIQWIDDANGVFSIRYAESSDGRNWIRKNIDCIKPTADESLISKPSVIITDDYYQMWYSYKMKGKYKIGYAESLDGLNWIKKDEEAGINISENSWDSDEIEYPFVFDHKGERYMLYNGNGYGKTGFGLARLIR